MFIVIFIGLLIASIINQRNEMLNLDVAYHQQFLVCKIALMDFRLMCIDLNIVVCVCVCPFFVGNDGNGIISDLGFV